jgi:hypothetical protein
VTLKADIDVSEEHDALNLTMGFMARSNTGVVGSIHSLSKDVCVRLFRVCVVPRVGSALRRADHPSEESYRLCIGLRK